MKKIAFVFSRPVQHTAPMFRMIYERGNLDVAVIYYTDIGCGKKKWLDPNFKTEVSWDIDMLSGYPNVVLHPDRQMPNNARGLKSELLIPALEKINPDVVYTPGYVQPLSIDAYHWACRRGKKKIISGDTGLVSLPRNPIKRFLKKIWLSNYLSGFDAFSSPGDQNMAYLSHYGVRPEKIFRIPLTVDVKRFRSVDGPMARDRVRSKWGIPKDGFVALLSGKLYDIKRPVDVVKAVATLKRQGLGAYAIILGSGPLEDSVNSAVKQFDVEDRVFITGFIGQKEIVDYQYAADCLVSASSRDQHPLVVTEAEACGLPVIASDGICCIGPTDTVQVGRNALVYPCGDIDALAASIRKLMDNPELRRRMGEESSKIADTQDISVAAEKIEMIVNEVFA